MRLSLVLFVTTAIASPADFRPTFVSEVLVPKAAVILPLLKVVCDEGVRTVTPEGDKAFGCGDGSMDQILASRHGPRRYGWMPYALWQADGIIFGRFLSPTSEDAAINCFACESHPDLWGGTLLLTKKAGKWLPLWYKAGVITRHCRRVTLDTGRQILLCEETDGGMGHSIHALYTVDFTNAKTARDSIVLFADSYSEVMLGGVQKQSIEKVAFEDAGAGNVLVRVYARHGRIKLRPDFEGERLPIPKVSSYEIDLQLVGAKLVATSDTKTAASLFGVR